MRGMMIISMKCISGYAYRLSRIHDIALELLKLDTDLITMTLDCCREVTRGSVVSLQ